MAGRHPAASTAGCSDFYGKLADVETTGASERTAKPEGLSYAGVPASEKIAQGDLKNMEKYKEKIIRVANSKGIEPALVAAIISRESHAGTTLKNGEGDHGNGFGLMQVDKRYHKVTGAWDSEEHIAQGTDILCQSITQIQKKFPAWSKEQQLKGNMVYSWALITAEAIIMVGALNSNYDTNTAEVTNAVGGGISAYNAGTKNVRTYERMDIGTTHDDYANDVVARAKFFKRNGY